MVCRLDISEKLTWQLMCSNSTICFWVVWGCFNCEGCILTWRYVLTSMRLLHYKGNARWYLSTSITLLQLRTMAMYKNDGLNSQKGYLGWPTKVNSWNYREVFGGCTEKVDVGMRVWLLWPLLWTCLMQSLYTYSVENVLSRFFGRISVTIGWHTFNIIINVPRLPKSKDSTLYKNILNFAMVHRLITKNWLMWQLLYPTQWYEMKLYFNIYKVTKTVKALLHL